MKCNKCFKYLDLSKQHSRGLCRGCYMLWWKKTPKGLLCQNRYNNSNTRKIANKQNNQKYGNKYFYNAINLWRKKNRDKCNFWWRRNKEIRKGIKSIYTFSEWMIKKNDTKGICPRCNNDVGLNNITLDHIIPTSKATKDFTYAINDIQPLCISCNCKKQDNLETSFAHQQFPFMTAIY